MLGRIGYGASFRATVLCAESRPKAGESCRNSADIRVGRASAAFKLLGGVYSGGFLCKRVDIGYETICETLYIIKRIRNK